MDATMLVCRCSAITKSYFIHRVKKYLLEKKTRQKNIISKKGKGICVNFMMT